MTQVFDGRKDAGRALAEQLLLQRPEWANAKGRVGAEGFRTEAHRLESANPATTTP